MADIFSEFNDIYQSRHQLAKEWKQKGNKVFGYFYAGVPEEIIYAAGILPVQIMESEDEETIIKGETILPEYVCDYCQSSLGQAKEGAYDYLDGLVIADACANLRTLLRAWEVHTRTPYYYFFTPPFQPTKEGRIYYAHEMVRFKKSLGDYCGKEISEESLDSAVEVYNENRRLIKELYELRIGNHLQISGSQMLEVFRAGLVMPKDEHNDILRKLIRNLPPGENETEEGVPLFLSIFNFEHCTTAKFNIFKMIEELGGVVTSDDLWMGPRYFSEPVERKPDLLEALVDRYLGKIPVGYRYPFKPRVDWLITQIERFDIKGCIVIIPKYCHPYLLEYPYLERIMKEKEIPTLFLESEPGMPGAPVRVRLQAFVEMLT
ncbi:2-hydroxyacyl-CoA dehydratase subunit D [Thermodesulfobacteriota bacterium]